MSSSPIDNVDWQYVVGEVAFLRESDPEKTCLMVEGQDDVVVYKKFIDHKRCQITNCHGKENLFRAIKALNQQQAIKGYIAIKDADFDVIEGNPSEANLFLTDGHDLEAMICASDAFHDYVDIYVSGEDLRLVDRFRTTLKEKLFAVGCIIGYLHWLSYKHRWGVSIKVDRFLHSSSNNDELTFDDAIKIAKSEHQTIDERLCDLNEFNSLLENYKIHLCRGHDLTYLIGRLFQNVSKKVLSKKHNPGNDVAKSLFLAYGLRMFKETKLFSDISQWEVLNPSFKVLTH